MTARGDVNANLNANVSLSLMTAKRKRQETAGATVDVPVTRTALAQVDAEINTAGGTIFNPGKFPFRKEEKEEK